MSKNTVFDYKFIEGDPTIQQVRDEEQFFGYRETKPIIFDSSYEELYDSIIADPTIIETVLHPSLFINEKNLRNSFSLWQQLGINLHDINILDKKYNIKKYTGIITEEFLDSLYTDSPSSLPIRFAFKQKDGKCECIGMGDPKNPENNGIIYREIIIPRLKGFLSSCCYAHEIAHTQDETIMGTNSSLLNKETISMLIEQIFASKLDSTGETLRILDI